MREFGTYKYRNASYRISPYNKNDILTAEIRAIREELEAYIKLQPEFLKSLVPIKLLPEAPQSAQLMAHAAELTGTGPMAAVAGVTAQLAAIRTAEKLTSATEIIIENGGDIFILPSSAGPEPVIAGIFSGLDSRFSGLALKIIPSKGGTAVCSSSSRMGHSLSLGNCDLCTAISSDASLADAAATLGGNLVKTEADLAPAAERLTAIEGIDGVLLIKNDQIAMAGHLPQIVRHKDPNSLTKITGILIE